MKTQIDAPTRSPLVTQRILKTFEERQREFERIEDPNAFLKAFFDETYDMYSERALKNIGKVLEKFLFIDKIGVQELISKLRHRVEYETGILEREAKCDFDLKYGTTTGLIVDFFDFEAFGSDFSLFNYVRYVPGSPDTIHRICDALEKLSVSYEDSTFIEIGSGMGRNLLIASEYPFKEITGVEISIELHEVAERNIKLYKNADQKCSSVKSVCVDALDFKMPDCDNLIIYLYHPFSELVFSIFFNKIVDLLSGEQRKITLILKQVIYKTVEESDLFSLKESFLLEDDQLSIYSNY